jgi:hypothetical protein
MAEAATREEQSRISLRALVIASVASALAALVTSQFWARGALFTAAVTPVIVTTVSELLHRHTQRLAERITVDRTAIRREEPLPDATGAGAPPASGGPGKEAGEPGAGTSRQGASGGPEPPPIATEPGERGGPSPVRVWRTRSPKFRLKLVLATAGLAFAIAAAVMTLPELIAGDSLAGGNRDTTLFGGGGRDEEREQEPEVDEPAPQDNGGDAQPGEAPQPEAPGEQPQAEPPPAAPGGRDGEPPPQTDTGDTVPQLPGEQP